MSSMSRSKSSGVERGGRDSFGGGHGFLRVVRSLSEFRSGSYIFLRPEHHTSVKLVCFIVVVFK